MARYNLFSCVTLLCLLNLILEATDGLSLPDTTPRTCVIGAGYSGLGAARHLKNYGVDFIVFEASRHIGGTWRFDPNVGIDEDGTPLFTSMYKNLRTNTPRQTMEFSGFPFPDGTPTYPEGTCFYKYLKSFAKKYDLVDNIQNQNHVYYSRQDEFNEPKYDRVILFNCAVPMATLRVYHQNSSMFQSMITSVKWAGGHWNVTYLKTDTKENRMEACHFVIVASGENLNPNWPKLDGMNGFEGKMMHSHDYKESTPFQGRRVLLVGAGASGLDLATQLSNITSKLIHSHHLKYNQPHFSKNYMKKPDVKAFTAKGVVFEDDSFEEIDDVVFCTGYALNHGFLDESSGVTATAKFVLPLYKQIVNIKHPTMTFIGVARRVINRVLDAQGEYVAALAAGQFKLPSQNEMLKNWLNHVYLQKKYNYKIVDVNVVGPETMDQYFGNLTAEAGINRAPPVLTIMRDFNAVNRLEDLLNYRNYDWTIIDDNTYKREYVPRKELPCPIEGE